MRKQWPNLNELERATFRVTYAFLNGRLENTATIDWALRLNSNGTIKQMALLDLINSPTGRKIGEPWLSAWRLIEESWNNTEDDGPSTIDVYDIQNRLHTGDRSGSLVTAIVELVAPRLKIEPFSSLHLSYKKSPRRPKRVDDLFSTGLKSGEVVDPSILKLETVDDQSFLFSLAIALDAAVVNGLDIARRIGWDNENSLWKLGQLYRVYYVPVSERTDAEHEPDEFHHGIAPSVKLLHAVVSRLVDVDTAAAVEFVRRWRQSKSSIHLRLWAALSRNPRITPPEEVSSLLLTLDDQWFWGVQDSPEFSELRARRFHEFDLSEQLKFTARIRKRPPRNYWRRDVDAELVEKGRLYWAVRELRRIELAGSVLPMRDKAWLELNIKEFPELLLMTQVEDGFMGATKARWVQPNPDSQYDLIVGEVRLKTLETALSSARRGWDDNPAGRATDWIRSKGNTIKLLEDLESIPDGGVAFHHVWERFGWSHSPEVTLGEDSPQRDIQAENARVLALLAKLPEATILQAIDGISNWLCTWQKHLAITPIGFNIWFKIWPIAVEATNANPPEVEEVSLNEVLQSKDNQESVDLDTLNTPAGKLVGVFLEICPNLKEDDRPFDSDEALRSMRDAAIAATGRAGLIVRHRLIESMPYYLRAAPEWTTEHLIKPLLSDNSESIALWRAIARQTHFSDVLKIIGCPMAERATDRRLGRDTRRSLVFSIVVECLYAFHEQREPAVPYARVQQMIRLLDDEVRAYGANTIQRFVRDVSNLEKSKHSPSSAERIFRSAAVPFLQQVWPQEHSFVTPGVSRGLADLPATAKDCFAEAVSVIERFLVPFECWSMHHYGFRGEEDGKPKLSLINNQEKAAALLRLLDLTVGTAEGAVIPHDLGDALDQIRIITPNLAENQVFRRLATATRRG